MRVAVTVTAWLLTGVLALASIVGYGAAQAVAPALEQLWPTPRRTPAWAGSPWTGTPSAAGAAAATRPSVRAVQPAGVAAPLASYAHLLEYLQDRTGWSEPRTRDLAALLIQEGARSGVDPWLLAAVIEVESRYRPDAVGSAGEIGLMQILPATGRRIAQSLGIRGFTEARLFDPHVNVRVGAAHLGNLLARHQGDEVAALTAYNAGRSTSIHGMRYAYRVLAVVGRVPRDVRLAWAPSAP
ncbi:MAG TPA: lytic transglycosylase domain-containing protein [Bacillota bacterium]